MVFARDVHAVPLENRLLPVQRVEDAYRQADMFLSPVSSG